MDVSIKSFDVAMDVKTKGIELEIRESNEGARLGDLFVTKVGLIWCKGNTTRKNGQKVKWTDFIATVTALQAPAKKAATKKAVAKKAAKKTAAKAPAPAAE
jgi:hypothetical protein